MSEKTDSVSITFDGIEAACDARWVYFRKSGSSIEDVTGKYLFFCADLEALCALCENEIERHGFKIAKISRIANTNSGDYVCCLYWTDESRKHELAERYKHLEDIKYRYWKSNADTSAGKYSKQYLQSI